MNDMDLEKAKRAQPTLLDCLHQKLPPAQGSQGFRFGPSNLSTA